MKQYFNRNKNQQIAGAMERKREQHFYQCGICLLDKEPPFTNRKFVYARSVPLANGRTSIVAKSQIKKDIGIVELSSTMPMSFCVYYGKGPPCMDTE